MGREVLVWSTASGMFPASKPPSPLRQPQPIAQCLEDIDHYNGAAIFVILDAHALLDAQDIVRSLRNAAEGFAARTKTLLFVGTQEKIPSDLARDIPAFYFPLPDPAELVETLAETQLAEADRAVIAQAAVGLTAREALRATRRALLEDPGFGTKDVHGILAEKARLVKKSSALTFLAPDAQLADVGGLELLKAWLVQRGKAFAPQAAQFGLSAPKGMLLLGVQGCGKSLCCKTIAAEWRMPLLRLDIGAIYDSYIGMSEANIRTALATAEAVAPCILWIDEIEKGLAGLGSSDGSDAGTTSRVFSTILSWLQEKSAPVFVAATANRIEGLPPELLRRGRFDEIFFVDLPNAAERKDIFAIHLHHRGRDPAQFALDALAQETAGYSGAEIEQIVIDALFGAFGAGHALADADLATAIADTVPLSRTMAEDIQNLQRWAYARARLASAKE